MTRRRKRTDVYTRALPAIEFRDEPIRAPQTVSDLSRRITQRVRELRLDAAIPQHVLEYRADLARGSLSRIESGNRGRMLTVDVVVRLADALGVDVGELITGKRAKR